MCSYESIPSFPRPSSSTFYNVNGKETKAIKIRVEKIGENYALPSATFLERMLNSFRS